MGNTQISEFDGIAEDYQKQHQNSIRLSGENVDYFAKYKIDTVFDVLGPQRTNIETIVDFGAGVGNSLPYFCDKFIKSNIIALDVSSECLKKCNKLNYENVETKLYDGKVIPLNANSVDLVFTACVFHHIDEGQHVALLKEIKRILKPGGCFFLFEHNPWNPLTLHAVKNCPFDENAVLINSVEMVRRLEEASFKTIEKRYHLFVPGYLSALRPIEKNLMWCPLGAQYSLCGIKG